MRPPNRSNQFPKLSPWRWMVFLALFGVIAWGFPQVPFEQRRLIFGMLGIVSLLALMFGVRQWRNFIWRNLQRLKRSSGLILIAWGISLATVAIMVHSAYWLRPQMVIPPPHEGWRWFLVGVACMGLALGAWRFTKPMLHLRWHPLAWVRDRQRELLAVLPDGFDFRYRWFLWGVVCLALVTQANILMTVDAGLIWYEALKPLSHHLQMLLLILGIGLISASLGAFHGLRPKLHIKKHHLALMLILVIGLVARLWNLELWITRWIDELHYAFAISRLWEAPQQILMPFSDLTAFSWFFPYLQSFTTEWLGPSFSALRSISVLFGMAQIMAVYGLASALFNRRTALIAALVIATFPAHLQFSRIGIANIADPVFGTLCFAFIARGIRYGSRRDFIAAGIALGLTQYFYEGGRLFYPPLVVAWIGWLWIFMRRTATQRFPSLRQWTLMAVMAASLIVPFYYTWSVMNVTLTPRFQAMRDPTQKAHFDSPASDTTDRLNAIVEKLPIPMQGLVSLGDSSWFYGGSQGFVLVPLVPLFLLGVAQSLWRWRSVGGSLLFWWLIASIVGNALLVDSLSAPRYLVVFPAIAILIAVGVTQTLPMVLPRHLIATNIPRFVALGAAVMVIACWQLGYYFVIHQPNYYVDRFYMDFDDRGRLPDTEDAMLRAVHLPPNTDVHIVSRALIWGFNTGTMRLYWQRQDLTLRHVFPQSFTPHYLAALDTERNQAFFLEPLDGEALKFITEQFTLDPQIYAVPSPYAIPADRQLWLYFVRGTEGDSP